MKILVTGATGFVGRHVLNELLKSGHTIIATTTSISKIDQENYPPINFVEFDLEELNDQINYFKYFHNPDLLERCSSAGG